MNVTRFDHATHRSSRPRVGIRCSLALLLLGIAATAQAAPATGAWVETWGQAMVSHAQPATDGAYTTPHLRDATLRQTVPVSVGGTQLRVRLSNVYGSTPLTIAAASVAPAGDDAGDHTAIDPARSHALRFDGKPTLTWKNKAGVSWGLTPDFPSGVLRTGPDNLYFKEAKDDNGRAFRLVLRRDRDGQFLPEVSGFRFGGGLYSRKKN